MVGGLTKLYILARSLGAESSRVQANSITWPTWMPASWARHQTEHVSSGLSGGLSDEECPNIARGYFEGQQPQVSRPQPTAPTPPRGLQGLAFLGQQSAKGDLRVAERTAIKVYLCIGRSESCAKGTPRILGGAPISGNLFFTHIFFSQKKKNIIP